MAGLAALSMNVFLPSLPGMAAYFDAEYAVMQLSVSLYLMMTALLCSASCRMLSCRSVALTRER